MRPEILKHFPYPSEKEGQGFIIESVIDAFESGVRNVIVEAPTGIGKTGVAVTVSRYMSVKPGDSAHLITSQKSLQRAYLKDDPNIRLMMGKSNYRCDRWDGFSCEDANHAFGSLCQGHCVYRQARTVAQDARITLHNFDSFLHQATLAELFQPRRLLCIDEAHDTEEHLVKAMSLKITEKEMVDLGLKWSRPAWNDEFGVAAWVAARAGEIKELLKETLEEMRGLVSSTHRVGVFSKIRGLSKRVQKMEKMQLQIERYETSSDKGVDWVGEVEDDSVLLEPVEAGRFANSALLKFGEFRLFMSATIFNNGKPLMKGLRLKRDETKYVSVGSSFPPERRPVFAANAGNLGHRDYRNNSSSMLDAVRGIMDGHPGVRGGIHCTSYKLSEEIRHNIDSDRFVSHASRDRGQVIDDFLAGKSAPDAVLLAVSVTQGYDFKHDLCRFQILVKVPYPYPSNRVVARKEIDPEYYDWRTALALVQTVGRGNRSEDDFCETYVLDSRFADFIRRKRKMLPSWFLDSVVKEEVDDDVFFA
jgi:Rad3-related DNA helicase